MTWSARAALRCVVAACLMVVVVGAVACGGDDDDAAPPAAKNGKVEGKLEMWGAVAGPGTGEWTKKFAAQFEKENPGAEIEITQYTTEEYWTKLLAAFSAGDEPDIFELEAGETLRKYVRTGRVAALNDLIDEEYWNAGALAAYEEPDGSIYGVPWSWYILNMYYDEGMFEREGVELPETWDELLAACETFSAKGVTPIALGNGGQDQFTATHWYDTMLYQYAGAGAALDATYGTDGASWNDPPFIEAATRFKELIDASCFPDGFTGINYTQMGQIFHRGDAAMIYTGAWFAGEIAAVQEEQKDSVKRVGVSALQDGPDAVKSTFDLGGLVGGAAGIAAARDAAEENPALVSAFLDALGDELDSYAKEHSQLSVAAKPKPTGDPLQEDLTELLVSVDELAGVTDVIVPSQMNDDYYQYVQALTAGELTPEEFGEQMAAAAERERPNLPELK